MPRVPRGYSGTEPTGKLIGEVLKKSLQKMGQKLKERPDLILLAWPEIVGPKIAPMTEAVSFDEGVLTVKVKNSTLHSLLATHEKGRLLKELRKKFPKSGVQNLRFQIG